MSGYRTPALTQVPSFETYVFDLDGTIYIDERAIPGAVEAIAALRSGGARVAFVTNNPLASADTYARRLSSLGVEAKATDVTTSVDALISYLREHYPGCAVLTIAESVVDERLAAAGFLLVSEPDRAEVVVVSFDRTFDYAKLLAAYRAVRHFGAKIVATNPDPYCPTADGGLPDCAAMLAALEACTGARAEAVVGKPSAHMMRAVLGALGGDPAHAAMIGDRLLTDVAMGQAVGAAGVLVLSGATRLDDLAASEIVPDYVLGSVAELI